MKRKRILSALRYSLLFFVLAASFCPTTLAHTGGTDANGGHYNRATGEYHYHHGYSEHQHIDGQCPYNFVDLSGQNSGSAGSSNGTSNAKEGNGTSMNNVLLYLGGFFIVSYVASLVRCLCISSHKGKLTPDNPLFGGFFAILYGVLFILSFPVSILRYWVRNYYIKFAVNQALIEQSEKNDYWKKRENELSFEKGRDAGYKEAKEYWRKAGYNEGYKAAGKINTEVLAAHDFVSQYAKRKNMTVPQYLEWAMAQQKAREEHQSTEPR